LSVKGLTDRIKTVNCYISCAWRHETAMTAERKTQLN